MDNLMDGYAPSTRFPTGIAHRLAVRLYKRLTRPLALPWLFEVRFILKTLNSNSFRNWISSSLQLESEDQLFAHSPNPP